MSRGRSAGRRAALWLLLLLLVLLVYLTAWPVPIDPAAWEPPPAPELAGRYATNDRLAAAEWFGREVGIGPESVAIDPDGRACTGYKDGRVMCFGTAAEEPELLIDTGGHPLGMEFDPQGNLYIADAARGLIRMDPEGKIEVLATEADRRPFGLVDDLCLARDGSVFFSDASYKFWLDDYLLDLLEHRPNGRLLRYEPASGATTTLLRDLYFANGVAVSRDQSFVLVSETGAYRIKRYWLAGPRRGEAEIFIDNLPGFPDNITTSPSSDLFWVAVASPRDESVDAMLPRPWLRKVVARLPGWLRPGARRHAMVLGIDADGEVRVNLQDPSPDSYSPITSAREWEGTLYLGSMERHALARWPVPNGLLE